METHNVLLTVCLGLILAISGLFVGLSLNDSAECPKQEVITETVEVPVEVEKIVEKIVEEEVKVSDLDLALEAFLNDLELDEYQEVRRVKLGDDYTITGEEDKVTVEFSVSYQILDTFTKERESFDVDVEVVFEEDEEVEVNY